MPPAKRKAGGSQGGRKLALDAPHPNPQFQTKLDALVASLGVGNYLTTACHYARVSPSTIHSYKAQGADLEARLAEHNGNAKAAGLTQNDIRKLEMLEAIKSAEAQDEQEAVALIRQAARKGTWQAAAWYLERKMPAKWGRWERQAEDTNADAGMTPAQAREFLSKLPDTPLAKHVDEPDS